MSSQTIWNIETATYSKIAATTAITSIIGTNPVRAFPEIRFDGQARPCIVYELASQTPYQVLNGVPTLSRSTMEIHCLADTKKAAIDLAQKVYAAFENWSGDYMDGAVLKIRIHSGRVQNIVTDYQPPADGAAYGLFIATVEVVSLHT